MIIFLDTERFGRVQDLLEVGVLYFEQDKKVEKRFFNKVGIEQVKNQKTIRTNHKHIVKDFEQLSEQEQKQDFKKQLKAFFKEHKKDCFLVWGRNDGALLKKYVSIKVDIQDYSLAHGGQKLEKVYNEIFLDKIKQSHTALQDCDMLKKVFFKDWGLD